MEQMRGALGGDGGGDVDDPPGALGLHDGHHGLHAVPDSLDVDGHDAVPLLLGDRVQRLRGWSTAKTAALFTSTSMRPKRDTVASAWPARPPPRPRRSAPPATSPSRLEGLHGVGRIHDVRDDDARPFLEEPPRIHAPDPQRAAGDDGHRHRVGPGGPGRRRHTDGDRVAGECRRHRDGDRGSPPVLSAQLRPPTSRERPGTDTGP